MIMLLLDHSFYKVKSMSRKIKIVLLCFFLSVRLMLMAIIVESAIIFILLASTTIELLGNVLSVLILDQVDNMGGILMFNLLRTNFNELTMQSNFMTV